MVQKRAPGLLWASPQTAPKTNITGKPSIDSTENIDVPAISPQPAYSK